MIIYDARNFDFSLVLRLEWLARNPQLCVVVQWAARLPYLLVRARL